MEANEKIARIEHAVRRRRVKHAAIWVVFAAALVGLIALAVWYEKQETAVPPGETYANVGSQHIALNASPPVPHNSNPPSSGAHFAQQANWGVYDYEVDDKLFIHNLEHGGIWISYRPGVSEAVINDLKAIVARFGGSKLIMAPRSANDTDIAVAAWTHVHKFNVENGSLSEDQKNQIRAFYKAYKNRGPEFVPDSMPGVDPKSAQN